MIQSETLKTAILNLNKALDTIEETSDILHEALVDKEFDSSEEWRAQDIEAFCRGIRRAIKEKALKHGYYYW